VGWLQVSLRRSIMLSHHDILLEINIRSGGAFDECLAQA